MSSLRSSFRALIDFSLRSLPGPALPAAEDPFDSNTKVQFKNCDGYVIYTTGFNVTPLLRF